VAIIDCSIPGSDLQARENFLYGMVLDAIFGFGFVLFSGRGNFKRVAIIDCSVPGSDLQARENFLYGMVLDAIFDCVCLFMLTNMLILYACVVVTS
jgi:hypothetical protein